MSNSWSSQEKRQKLSEYFDVNLDNLDDKTLDSLLGMYDPSKSTWAARACDYIGYIFLLSAFIAAIRSHWVSFIIALSAGIILLFIGFLVQRSTAQKKLKEFIGSKLSSEENLFIVIRYIFSLKQFSCRELERKFSIGYARAARLLDIFEHLGIVEPRRHPEINRVVNKYQINNLLKGYSLADENVWVYLMSRVKKEDPDLHKSLESMIPVETDGIMLLLKSRPGSKSALRTEYNCLERIIEGLIGKKIFVKCIG